MKITYSKRDPGLYRYKTKSGKELWGFRYKYYNSLNERKEVKRQGFSTQTLAKREMLKFEADVADNNFGYLEASNMTVEEWFTRWFETYKGDWKISTVKTRESIIKRNIIPFLGNKKLQRLSRSEYIRLFIRNLESAGYKPKTIKNRNAVFNIGINAAVKEEILDKNRFSGISIDDSSDKKNFIDANQLNKLLKCSKEEMSYDLYAAIYTLAHTGMRVGELMALRWQDFDTQNKTLDIKATRDFHGYRPPKTKNSFRKVYITDSHVTVLKELERFTKEDMFRISKKISEDDYIFTYQTAPLSHHVLRNQFHLMTNELKLLDLTLHGLRHTHATLLMSNGTPANVIADRLGNTAEMVMNTYGHVLDDMRTNLADDFSEILYADDF